MKKHKIPLQTKIIVLLSSIFLFLLIKNTFGYQDFSLTVYTSSFDGYSISYSSDFFLKEAHGLNSVVTLTNYDSTEPFNFIPTDSLFALDIVALDNPKRLSIEQFWQWHDKNNFEGTSIKTVVHSVTPITVNSKNGVLREITTLATVWEALIDGGDKIYLLAARKDEKFESIFNQILYSFRIEGENIGGNIEE
mgnify:CR=1 FL=1